MWLSFLFAHCNRTHFSVEVSHYFQEKCGQTHVLPNLLISRILFISQIKKSLIKTEFLKGHIVRFPFDQNGFPVNQTFLSSWGGLTIDPEKMDRAIVLLSVHERKGVLSEGRPTLSLT